MSIDNGIVVLADGVPAVMKWSAVVKVNDQRRDPLTGFVSTVTRWSAQVTQLNGADVLTVFDTLSEKLGALMDPFIGDPSISSRTFTLTRTGTGYLTEYSLAVSPGLGPVAPAR